MRQIPSIRYQVSDIKYQISSFRYYVSGIKYQISDIEYQISNIWQYLTISQPRCWIYHLYCYSETFSFRLFFFFWHERVLEELSLLENGIYLVFTCKWKDKLKKNWHKKKNPIPNQVIFFRMEICKPISIWLEKFWPKMLKLTLNKGKVSINWTK